MTEPQAAPDAQQTADLLAKLHRDTRIPPAELVGKLDKGFGQLDYLGHAAVTNLLLQHDPCWSWEPVAVDDAGRPLVDRDAGGWPRGLWIRLTVHGHTRLGYGTCAPNKPDAVKELIGDALRNAAMRFGVGLSLWAKEEWADEGVEAGAGESRPGGRSQRKTSGKEGPKENAPRAGNTRSASNVSQLPVPTDEDVARHPAGGPLLRQDQAIAARAEQLGLDEQTRVDVIRAVAGPQTMSGKDLEASQVTQVMRNLRWLADGFVELSYDEAGVPSIHDTRPPNPGPSNG